MTHDDFKGWPPEFQAALKAYSEVHGEGWEQDLCADWATGRDTHFPIHGATLRGIRNHPECAPVIYGRAEAGEGVWFRNHYTCPQCGFTWQDTWTATCDDDCPSCGKRHISPTHSEDV